MAIRRKDKDTIEIDVEIFIDPQQDNKTSYKFPFDTLQDLVLLNPDEIKELINSIVLNNDKRVQDFIESQKGE